MKKILISIITIVMLMSLVACSTDTKADGDGNVPVLSNNENSKPKGNSANDLNIVAISKFNLSEAQQENNYDPFETIEPIHNVPEDKQFTIKLNLGTEPFDDFMIEDQFAVYTDRKCENKLIADIYFDRDKNEITIRPDESSWGMYARKGVDSDEIRNWGGLQTYYLLIKHDVTATKVTKLERPKRMMFTVQSKVDIPTVTVKHNSEGNLTLYWKPIEGATGYKVYRGSPYEMKELGNTETTEFTLNEDEYRNVAMNTLVSNVYDYAVVAVNGNDESRLSNIIIGEDLVSTAIAKVSSDEETYYNSYDIDSILDLPLKISVDMVEYVYENNDYVKKSLPVIWDFDNLVMGDGGVEQYHGKVLGTTFTIIYVPFGDLPTVEEIEEFKKKAKANEVSVGATENEDQIDIPNAPSNEDSKEMVTKDVNEIVSNEVETPEKSLEIAIAEGMLNHEESIDLSMYQESSDPVLLKDILLKVITQYPLILDDYRYGFDFPNKRLLVAYRWSKDEAVRKQEEVINKVNTIVNEIIKPEMTVDQKEQVLHDWILNNGEYHMEILEAYYDGKDMNIIADQYADTFNPYGILINGLGVCQSYAEAYKLLCDAAEVPCVVASGTLGTVPHAWNKVRLDGTWYHVDATNNDGDGAIPYAVFNASDRITSTDFTTGDEYILDSELESYVSDKDDKDYYMISGDFAQSEVELQELLNKHVKSGEAFCIKIDPSISDDRIIELIIEAYADYEDLASKAMLNKMFNVLEVTY